MKIKPKKLLKIAGAVIGAFLLLIILTILFWLGPTVKLIAEIIGPKALGTEVQIEKLKVNPIKGTIALTDFTIKNPDVFGQTNAVSLASLEIDIDMASLFSSTITVHRVEINSPYLVYEQDLQSDNITAFIRNVQAFANIDPNAPQKPEKEKKKKPSGKPAPIVIVEQLEINDVQLNFANTHDHELDIGVGFESLAISMTNGTAFLDKVYVKNPGRLETPNLFTLDGINIEMVPGSVYSTNIHFKLIEILNPHAFIEHNPQTDTFGEFLKIADSLIPRIPTNAPEDQVTNAVVPETPQTKKEPSTPPTEITLDLFLIDDAQLHAVNIGDPDLDIHLGMSHFSVALERGIIQLEDLHLSNPAQLSTPDLLSLEKLYVQLTPGSEKTETLVIEDVQIIKPNAFLELNTDNNTVSAFLRTANSYIERIPTYKIPALPPTPEKPTAPDTAPKSSGVRKAPPVKLQNLMVDDLNLYLRNTTNTNHPSYSPRLIAGIDEVDAKLMDGTVGIHNIRIPNSPGFNASNIFHLAQITIALEADSLYSDQVVINEIFIDTPLVDLEQTETSGNVSDLQAALMQFVPTPEQMPKFPESKKNVAATEEPATTNTPILIADQPIVLHQLTLTNLAINLKLPITTNRTENMMGSFNPMDKISLNKLNPMHAGSLEEVMDPNAPIKLVAFKNLSLEPLKGLLYIDDMRISNPPGFSRNNLVEIEQFRLDIDPDSIQTDIFHIEDILIQKPRIRYERQIKTDNIKALQQEIEKATMRRQNEMEKTNKTQPTEHAETTPVQTAPPEDEQKVIIDRVQIPNGLVRAKLSIAPAMPVPLPTIEIKDIGKEGEGATLAEAGSILYGTVYDSIIKAVANTTGFATDTLKGIGGLTFDALGGVSDGIGNMTKGATEAAEKTIEKSKERRRRRAGGRRTAVP